MKMFLCETWLPFFGVSNVNYFTSSIMWGFNASVPHLTDWSCSHFEEIFIQCTNNAEMPEI